MLRKQVVVLGTARDAIGITFDIDIRSSGWIVAERLEELVRKGGLEPPRLAAPDPKSGASANSATPAYTMVSHAGFEPATL